MFRRLFGKRENVFVKLIREQASLTLEGMEALKTFLATGDPEASALLNAKEKAADEARRILKHLLQRYGSDPVAAEAGRYLEVMNRIAEGAR